MYITDSKEKQELVQSLLEKGNITFDEALLLLKEPKGDTKVPFYPVTFPPNTSPYGPIQITPSLPNFEPPYKANDYPFPNPTYVGTIPFQVGTTLTNVGTNLGEVKN